MDRILPFVEPMGLHLPEPERFVVVLRRIILRSRVAFSIDPGQIPPIERPVLTGLTQEFDRGFAERFRRWVLDVFSNDPGDHLEYQHWRNVLDLAANNPGRWSRLGFPQVVEEMLRQELRDSFDLSAVHGISDALEEQGLSVWDVEMYARHGFYSEFRDPETWVVNTVSHHQFRSWVRSLAARVSAADLQAVWQNSRVLLRELPALGYIEDLRPLALLVHDAADQ